MAKRNDTPEQATSKPQHACTVRHIKIGHTHDRHLKVPWIRLQGQWLSQAGFVIDTQVHVHVMDGCLIVKAIS